MELHLSPFFFLSNLLVLDGLSIGLLSKSAMNGSRYLDLDSVCESAVLIVCSNGLFSKCHHVPDVSAVPLIHKFDPLAVRYTDALKYSFEI